ncbi:MAG: hypothetical protein HXS48_07270 [Theionarchaea archaeon]|nr:MAG: hypothetical protein AYK19_20135 [Theionarchaea archaeon DG-70-1]MBU7026727.1 hypothetical protein [Theionarchaea archaeon]
MAKSKTLFESDTSCIRENPVPISKERQVQKAILLKITAEEIEPDLDITDEHIPTFESSALLGPREINNIPFTNFESPSLKKDRIRQYIDEIDPELERMPTIIDPDVQNQLIDILEIYKSATAYFLNLESKSKKYNFSRVLQLKDILDQISAVLTEHLGDKEKQLISLDLIKNHLRTASIENIESLIAEMYSSILRCLDKPRIYYKFTFFSLPDKSKIDAHIETIKYHLRRSHQLGDRNWEFCLEEYKKAYKETLILRNLLPDSNEAKYRFFVILISLISATMATISFF